MRPPFCKPDPALWDPETDVALLLDVEQLKRAHRQFSPKNNDEDNQKGVASPSSALSRTSLAAAAAAAANGDCGGNTHDLGSINEEAQSSASSATPFRRPSWDLSGIFPSTSTATN